MYFIFSSLLGCPASRQLEEKVKSTSFIFLPKSRIKIQQIKRFKKFKVETVDRYRFPTAPLTARVWRRNLYPTCDVLRHQKRRQGAFSW